MYKTHNDYIGLKQYSTAFCQAKISKHNSGKIDAKYNMMLG